MTRGRGGRRTEVVRVIVAWRTRSKPRRSAPPDRDRTCVAPRTRSERPRDDGCDARLNHVLDDVELRASACRNRCIHHFPGVLSYPPRASDDYAW